MESPEEYLKLLEVNYLDQSIEPPSELLLEVQNPGRFYTEFGEFAAGNDAGVHRLMATDTSTEAVFDYLMKRAARPE